MAIKRLLVFVAGVLRQRPSEIVYLFKYLKSMLEVRKNGYWNGVKAGTPWVSFRALSALDRMPLRSASVFEFGAGGSTIFFAERAATVISVEHNPRWHEEVASLLAERALSNVECRLAEAQNGVVSGEFLSHRIEYAGMSFSNYVSQIDDVPDESLDLVFVDGRARVACIKRSISKIKSGGRIVLDNGDRKEYQSIVNELETLGWRVSRYSGFTPGIVALDETIVFERLF